MPHDPSAERLPLKLTLAQRKAIAALEPDFAERLKLDQPNQRTVAFTVAELQALRMHAEAALGKAGSGAERRPLRHVVDAAAAALDRPPQGADQTIYQLKITLLGTRPPVWRRIQVPDCTLDQLHEDIQTAMGWTNSHLHHFRVGEQLYGAPDLMQENFGELGYWDSTTTKLSDLLPAKPRKLRFIYEYDFGDSWEHQVLFEGTVPAEPRVKYPRCVDGARACPPEDCGGVWGYADFLEAIRDPDNEQHEDLLEWAGGRFDPERFDAAAATKAMRRGLPDWRQWV